MYFVTVAASAMIVMAAAFIMNAVRNEGWLSRERLDKQKPQTGQSWAHTSTLQ